MIVHESFVVAALESLPEPDADRALTALADFLRRARVMAEARARGVSVAPLWRDPLGAIDVEVERRELLGDPASFVFAAARVALALAVVCDSIEGSVP